MALYAVTIALSAFLLFLIQPVIAKQILPWFGGSAAVWTTCVAFFQLVLLAGYAYADVTARRLSPRRLALLHSALLAASLATLPAIPSDAFKPGDPELPIGRILLLLTATIGLPYLMLSTTAPLVQAWFARSFRGARVYRLYALSNVASMLALLSYPALLEPLASARAQALGWSVLYAVFALLCIGSAWYAVRTGGDALPLQAAAAADPPPSRADQLLWLLLAALGSTMLLGVTTHITQNIASIPFLWVLPLAIYLVTFILCFDGKGWYLRTQYVLLSAVLGVAMMAGLSYRFDFDDARLLRGILHIDYAIPLYSFGLFVVCMFCHGELVERKPAPAYLTRFYLMVAAGGAIGGTLVAGIAPLVFAAYWEFPAAVTVAMLLTFLLGEARLRALGAVATLACAALLVDYVAFVRSDVVQMMRNFYGTVSVETSGSGDDARLRLVHGVIAHGEQFVAGERRRWPTTYYGETSGVGRTIAAIRDASGAPQRIGLIGLGTGTLLTYGRAGDRFRVYELNPQVLEVARSQFTYLVDSAAQVEVTLGDARLSLERAPPQRFDLLAVDAFSSDAIPTHLMTREALQVYLQHLAPGGAIAFHISNRYLALAPVVGQLASEAGLQAVRVIDEPPADSHLYRSDWVVVTADDVLAQRLRDGGGQEVPPQPGLRPWTDDYNNLFQVLK